MIQFRTNYERKIDGKNRVTIPREVLGIISEEQLYLQDRLDERVLYLHPASQVEKLSREIPSPLEHNFSLEEAIQRNKLIGSLNLTEPDQLNRITLRVGNRMPQSRKVYWVGMETYLMLFLGSEEEYRSFKPDSD